MISILIRRFIPNFEQISDKKVRESYGVFSGVLGMICNLFLFAVKLSIGVLIHSIAVISDAFNNLSDMASSLITVVGVKLSNRHADKEHPFGHGRIEYISALIVSFFIMLVGVELFKGAFEKILHPQKPEMSVVLLLFLSLSVLVKVWMFSYNRYIGKQIHSAVLLATAKDSLNDVIATVAVIFSTFLGSFTAFPVDGAVGLIVSVLVLWTGFGIARDTIGVLLGGPPDPETVRELKEIILSQEGIVGIHDLIIHDYGPGRVMASVHAEVPSDADIVKIHEVIDQTEREIYSETDVRIVIHMDPIAVNNERVNSLRAMVLEIVKEVDSQYNIHDFRMTDGEDRINLIFDLEVPCELPQKKREEAVLEIKSRLRSKNARYQAVICVDDTFA